MAPTERQMSALPTNDPTATVAASVAHNNADIAVPALPTIPGVEQHNQHQFNAHHHHAPAMATAVPVLPPPQEEVAYQQPQAAIQEASIQEAATMLTTAATAANNGVNVKQHASASSTRMIKKRKRRSYYTEPTEPLPQGMPFNPDEYPELAIDFATNKSDNNNTTDHHHRSYLHLYREPLFPKDPSPALHIAYSHVDAAAEERRRIRMKKKATLRELKDLRAEFHAKKQELLEMNSKLCQSTEKVCGWTKKVFDLELSEPCTFNDKLQKLRDYHTRHGKIPDNSMKTKGTEEERLLATFVSGVRNKVKKGHKTAMNFPHRLSALEDLGVNWESENDTRFEYFFGKLLEYRKEHGTFRMPSLDLCKETGDKDLIALHNWVFSQVGSFRYQLKSKKVETVQRFLGVGFSFERWYATNGHVYEREIPPFDEICRRYVANGGEMDENDLEILRQASNTAKMLKGKARKKNKKRKRKGGIDEDEVEAAVAADAKSPPEVAAAVKVDNDVQGQEQAVDGDVEKAVVDEAVTDTSVTKAGQQQQQEDPVLGIQADASVFEDAAQTAVGATTAGVKEHTPAAVDMNPTDGAIAPMQEHADDNIKMEASALDAAVDSVIANTQPEPVGNATQAMEATAMNEDCSEEI